ncbi:MAG: DUF3313 family protein [Gammaproteobacteria bacterium]
MRNSRIRSLGVAAGLLGAAVLTSVAGAEEHVKYPVDEGFLSVAYTDMRIEMRDRGFDLVYIAPGAFERLGDYDAVMIDQPEIWIDKTSDYPGTKADYLKALVDVIRDKLAGALIRGGHDVVETPAPRVAFIRVALTDLYLKKKPGKQTRGYTAIGSQTQQEMIKTMMKYFDVVEMALQLEVVDLETEELLGAVVIQRGERGKKRGNYDERLDFAELLAIVDDYAGRVRCRFDNGRLPQEDWVDCAAVAESVALRVAAVGP